MLNPQPSASRQMAEKGLKFSSRGLERLRRKGPSEFLGTMQDVAVVLPGKFIFLAQPHTGSSAMVLALQDAFPEALDLRPHHMSLADVRGQPGATRMEQISRARTRIWDYRPQKRQRMKGGMDPDSLRRYLTGKELVFTVIRNPYDFLATCYVRRGGKQGFASFVKTYSKSPYIENSQMYYHVPDCDEVLTWEKMPLCVDRLMRKMGLPELNLGRHNVTKDKKPWPEYFSPKAFNFVNERFGDEFSQYYKMRTS